MSATTSVVTGVDFVSIPTRDIARAVRFYENVLGRPFERVATRGEEPRVEFETGTVTIALVVPERLGIPFQPHRVPIAPGRGRRCRAGRARVTRRCVPG